ncbi:hypothetical protein CAPTEDRAFT_228240 [Capitella teleta]|uniref:Protein kinase domain-containing protein n=1 Tax=Capitella teleta TaxID=283909 RepID=R7ULM2_CAPTE|nr:hypothetical protein CAPTEDRAFT_228240 [Capitella teleta]|eukprot:ELU07085.1 hypothetical protein CAPTEDRAFT_228240 [Capitella teleta]
MAECNLCHKHVFRGKVCKDCKMKFHKECAAKVAPACGLPNALVDYYMKQLRSGNESPNILRHNINHTVSLPVGADGSMVHAASVPAFAAQDSGSTTSGSCNSSTPSSPAPSPSSAVMMSSGGSMASPQFGSQFTFPEISTDIGKRDMSSTDQLSALNAKETASSITLTDSLLGNDRIDVVNTNTSNDSDKSDKTLVDTNSSGDNRSSVLDRVDSTESGEDGGGQGLSWSRVNSMSIKEWDIPYEELQFEDRIGDGRFGSVYKGNWHGDVAIKMLTVDSQQTDQTSQLQAFKREIAMLRKTRHENLVLFMGACMNPMHLAIVTSLCKHQTLFTHIHLRKEKFAMNRIIIIASQIAQGMGYLHAKGIVHKDLKSKNIFIENGKVVITDFGLFNVTKLCHGNRKGEWLSIPPGWLCYLAPEVIRSLQAFNHMDLPFSKASDVYAFGTVWYELLCGEWPFHGHPSESIIWQVGRGMKQSLGALQASKDVKDVLMSCWAYSVDERPNYSRLLKTFERLPRKRLARCPSHPIQLSRSAESVF